MQLADKITREPDNGASLHSLPFEEISFQKGELTSGSRCSLHTLSIINNSVSCDAQPPTTKDDVRQDESKLVALIFLRGSFTILQKKKKNPADLLPSPAESE